MSVPTYAEEENGEQLAIMSCPIRFIPGSVLSFLEHYDYAKSFPGTPMPAFDRLAPRFKEAMRYYESQMTTMAEELKK